jgi:hypothetical protein
MCYSMPENFTVPKLNTSVNKTQTTHTQACTHSSPSRMPHTAACCMHCQSNECLFPAVAAHERPCLCPSCTHCTSAAASMHMQNGKEGVNTWRATPMHAANFDQKRWRVHALTPVESRVLGLFGPDENFLRLSPSLSCCLCM